MNRTGQKGILILWMAVMAWLACGVEAAVPPEWLSTIPDQQYVVPVRARVKLDGEILTSANGGPGSYIAAYLGNELRGVAAFDDLDGYYFYNLTIHAVSNTETGYTFKFYNPKTDEVVDCEESLDYTALGYGKFDNNFNLVPQIITPKSLPALPTVSIVANDPSGTEPGTGTPADIGQFTISRKGAKGAAYTTGEIVVNLQISGTATNGVDYTTITTTSKITDGKSSNTKTVTPLADNLVENSETVIITILPGDGYVVGTPSSATVTIIDRVKPEWEYTLDGDGKAVITAYNGQAKAVVVPTALDGHAVTAIASGAFGNNNAITAVTLPVSIKQPAENVFSGCTNLKTVTYTLEGIRTDFGDNVAVNLPGMGGQEKSVALFSGWNLVSLPQGELLPESQSALQQLQAVFCYDPTERTYRLVTDIEADKPYWIFSGNDLVLKIKAP